MMNALKCAAVLGVLLCVGCREGVTLGARQIGLDWDTLHVDVTELDLSTPPRTWSVTMSPSTNEALASASAGLFEARSATMLDASRFAVANTGANQLLFVSGEGVRTVGAEGGGPGEFEALWSVHRGLADSIVAYDRANRRLSWFTADGVYRRSRRLRTGLPGELQVLGPLNDTTWAVILLQGPEGFRLNQHGPSPRFATLALLTDAEQVVELGEFPYAEEYVLGSSATRRIYRRPVPGSRRMEAASGLGSVVLAFTDEYRLGVFDERGTLVRFLLAETLDRPASVADRQAWISSAADRAEDEGVQELYRLMWQSEALPERWPKIGDVMVSSDRQIWVENIGASDSTGTVWDVWDLAGNRAARAFLPPDVEILDVGSDALVGRARDGLGREYVRVYDIER